VLFPNKLESLVHSRPFFYFREIYDVCNNWAIVKVARGLSLEYVMQILLILFNAIFTSTEKGKGLIRRRQWLNFRPLDK